MIPDHLIDKAWHAYVRSSNQQAIRNELAYPDLRGPMPPPPDTRQSMRAALEAVAAEIWDDAIDAAAEQGVIQIPDNPYRASETA